MMGQRLKRLSGFDWFLILCVMFLICGTVLRTFYPSALKKIIRDYPTPRYGEITVALNPSYEWLGESIATGDKLMDSLEGRVWAEILGSEVAQKGTLKGRTLVRVKVLVMQGDSGPTVFSRYKIRRGERFVFECPTYIFESTIVDWKDVG